MCSRCNESESKIPVITPFRCAPLSKVPGQVTKWDKPLP
uniref:Uncharacterized protein n=1 Tax=Utricularia reniformis TaxID=192314 RepID=A0A1Y0AZH1_9LAMI|nr:hypothetical protein AEK19_MT0263 [Utricularia reniformis]ART30540.1 hypothetical protein AEK19_MT0263 [Utricularia reniformis]